MKFLLSVVLYCLFFHPLFAQNTLDNAGLTSATPAQVAFSLRKLSSTYSGFALKVRRASDNAEANVAFDGAGNLTASSLVSFTPGVTIGATTGTTQTGTISTDVSKTGTITINANKTGTITTAYNTTTVTGTGTSFTTELVVGDRIFNGATNVFLGVVASITNNTTLLFTNYATQVATMSFKSTGAVVTGTGTNFTGELATGDRLFNSTNTYLGTVASITNATSLTLNAVDAVTSTGISFKSTVAAITGTGTNFTSLTVGDLLISNNITLGIISSITNATSLTLSAKAGGSVSALAFKSTTGTIAFSTFYASTSVFVNTWYDQSGYGRDAIQLKTTNQARIVNAGTLSIMNSRTSMEFSNSLNSFLQTSAAASYLNNTLYTLNKVTAEATINPILQLPISTTGGNGPGNSISHYGYRSSSLFTVAQYGNDQNFNATPSTSMEVHTSVKITMGSSQFYKNGTSLGIVTSGIPSHLSNVGVLNIGFYTPTSSYYSGSISELAIFSTALNSTDLNLFNNNQLTYYNIANSYWTGAVSTDWNNAGNWSAGIPTISSPSIVVIPAGKPFYPVISGTSPANSISLEAGTSLTITGTLQLAGTLNNFGTCTASGGTVQYSGLAPQAIASNTFAGSTVQNVIISNSTGVSLSANFTVSGNLTFSSGKLAIGAYTLTLGGTVTNTVTGGLTGSSNSSLVINGGTASPTLSFDQTTNTTTNALRNLTINSSGQVVTLANDLILIGSGNTTFSAGKLAIGSSTLTIRGGIVNTVSEGIRGSTSGSLVVDGTLSPTLSFDQTTSATTNTLRNLTINSSGQVVTLANNLILASTGTTTFTAGKLAIGSSTLTIRGAIVNTVNEGIRGSTSGSLVVDGTLSSTLSFDQTTTGTTNALNNLTINCTGQTITLNRSLVIGTSLNLTAGTLVDGGNQISSTGTLNLNAASYFKLGSVTAATTWPAFNTNTITAGSTVEYASGVLQVVSALPAYQNLVISGNGTSVLPAATINILGNLSVNGTVTTTGNTIVMNGISAQAINGSAAITLNNLTINNNAAPVSLSQNLNVANTLTFTAGKLSIGSNTLTLSGNVVNTVPNGITGSTSGNLIINGSANPTLSFNQSTPAVSNALNNFTVNSSGQTLLSDGDLQVYGTMAFTSGNLAINGNTLSLKGTTSYGTGTLKGSSTSNLVIGGTAVINFTTGAGHNYLKNLTVNGSSNMTIGGNGLNISAGTTAGTVVVDGTLITGGYLTLKSDVNGTARVGNSTGNISGKVTVERYIPARRAWRLMGVPISSADAPTINAAWQEGATSSTSNINPGFGTHITGGTDVNGFDQSPTNSSNIKYLLANSWQNLSNTNTTPVTQHPGYFFFIRGDRSYNITSSTPVLTPSATVLRVSGNLNQGTQPSVPVAATGLTLVSNPYASPVSLGAIIASGTNIKNRIYVLDPSLGGMAGVGGYVVLDWNGSAYTAVPTSSMTSTIQAGQAFFVLSGDGTSPGSMVINESHKVSTTYNAPFGRGTNTDATLKIDFKVFNADKTIAVVDGVMSHFSNDYSNEVTNDDALKSGNMSENFAIVTKGKLLTIERRSMPTAADTMALYTSGLKNTDYQLEIVPGNFESSGVTALLYDLYKKTFSPISNIDTTRYTFSVTSDALSKQARRFSIVFSSASILPVTITSVKATATGPSSVQVEWDILNEQNISHYEVEKYSAVNIFIPIGKVQATTSGTAKATYHFTDAAATEGENLYRIKSIGFDGQFKYSAVVKLTMKAKQSAGITVYPNPVVNATITLALSNMEKGLYTADMYNSIGQKIFSQTFTHPGGNAPHSFTLNNTLTKGIYHLQVVNNGQIKQTISLSKE